MIEAAGVAIQYANKILLLKRSNQGDHAGVFAFAGGKIEDGETPEQAVTREAHEEIGYDIVSPLTEIAHTNDGRVDYTTYVTVAPEAFNPILNDEHDGFAWVTIPEAIETLNLHPAVKKLLVDTLDAQRTTEQIRSDSIETETDILRPRKSLATSFYSICASLARVRLTAPSWASTLCAILTIT